MNKDIFNETAKYYDENACLEDRRLSDFSSEFRLTNHMLNRYVVNNKCVLDVGGGTGVYAFPLVERGNKVILADISKKEIEIVNKKAKKKNIKIQTKIYNAIYYNNEFENKFDVVLCLGPLYHCSSIDEIDTILNNILRYTKKQGRVFLSFLSKYSKFNDLLREEEKLSCYNIIQLQEYFEKTFNDKNTFIFERRNKLPISFVTPDKLEEYLSKKGLKVDLISCIDYLSNIPTTYTEEIIDFYIDLGKSIRLNSGSHILVVLERTK